MVWCCNPFVSRGLGQCGARVWCKLFHHGLKFTENYCCSNSDTVYAKDVIHVRCPIYMLVVGINKYRTLAWQANINCVPISSYFLTIDCGT